MGLRYHLKEQLEDELEREQRLRDMKIRDLKTDLEIVENLDFDNALYLVCFDYPSRKNATAFKHQGSPKEAVVGTLNSLIGRYGEDAKNIMPESVYVKLSNGFKEIPDEYWKE